MMVTWKANEAIRRTIGGWKTVHGLDTETAAGQMGMSRATFARRKKDPSTMTLAEFRSLIILAGADEAEIIRMVTGEKSRG